MDKYFEKLSRFSIAHYRFVAAVLLVTVVSAMSGFPFFTPEVKAINLIDVSDTLSSSDRSAVASHSIVFTMAGTIASGATFSMDFDPAFALPIAGNVTCPDSATAAVVSSRITCTAGGGGISSGTKTVVVLGATNPAASGSYQIDIIANSNAVGAPETGTAMVAIIDNIDMTAAVEATLVFRIDAIAAGQTINTEATTTMAGTTAHSIPWGTLAPNTSYVQAHGLSVATNALSGFVVTLQQNQNMLSDTNADIDLFQDGAATSAPIAWVDPANTLDSENTYGHYGITSEDSDLNTNEFGDALYAGNIAAPRVVFSHGGPADGTTADKGYTRIGYKIRVTALQEAANDYRNILMYIATPTY